MGHDPANGGGGAAAERRAPESARRHHIMLAAVFVVAFALRVLYWWGQAENNPLFGAPLMDEGKHHEWAELIVSGQGLGDRPFFRAPLFYYLLAGFYWVFGVNPAAARLAACAMGAASCYLIARLGIALSGFRVGIIAGTMAAVYWPLIYFDEQLLSASLEIFLNLLMLLFLLRAVQRYSWWLFLLAGLAWGLSAVARPNVLMLAPGLGIWLWMAVCRPPRAPGGAGTSRLAAMVRAAVLLFGGAAVAILPVTARNYAVSGDLVLIASNGGLNFYIGNNSLSDGITAIAPRTRPTWEGGYDDTHEIVRRALGRQPTEGEVSRYWYGRAWEWILSEPGAWAALMVRKFRMFWSPLELSNNQPIQFFAEMSGVSVLFWVGFPVVACLGAAGLLTIGSDGRAWLRWSLPVLFGVIYSATVIAFFVPARYRLPVTPVFILLAAQGLARLPEYWTARQWRALAMYAAVAGLCAVFVWTNPPPAAAYHRNGAGQGHHALGIHYQRLAAVQPEARELAAFHFRETVRLRPDDVTMGCFVAASMFSLGYVEYAESLIARAMVQRPESTAVLMVHAEFLVLRGRMSEAIQQCQKVIELQPTESSPHVMIGALLMHVGREAEARVHLNRAIELGADPVRVWHELGSLLLEQGRAADALVEFEKVLQRDPTHIEALFASARALERLGRPDEAARRYRDLLQEDPTHQEAARARGRLRGGGAQGGDGPGG